jgi:pyruvate/2-oxoglutarate dehydrogenase complex dihydrolipoamide dehydrogenase (E3) component
MNPDKPQNAGLHLEPWDVHNRRLAGHAHPADWVNPKPAGKYNLVVVGAGTAGLVTAAGAAGLGAKVALIERRLMGGDCLNYGCVPSKALIRSARAFAEVRAARELGIKVSGPVEVDFGAVMERMRRLRADISPHDSAARFRDLGIDVFLGAGRFTGPESVEVGGETLRFAKAVIATGARPAIPVIPGLDGIPYLTNETVFGLTELPRRLAIVGAGPIGCELAQTFARFGAEVLLLGSAKGMLPREDRDAADIVRDALVRDGVKFVATGREVRFSKAPGGILVAAGPADETHFVADAVLIATGRTPNVEGLGLESAGVEAGPGGVKVDDYLRTANRRIYACGDVCSRYQFTHAADFMARAVIRNALFHGRARASALLIPWCTYTSPEIARVGLSESQAREEGVEVSSYTQPMAGVDRAILDGETGGFVRVLVRRGTDRIAGATLVGPSAGELISEITLAMNSKAGLGALANSIHPYPTLGDAVRKTGDSYNKTRLTPMLRAAFGRWLRWQRK